jgi:maltose alpha-D-glucosyltransferase/alpha-amylase
MRTVDAPQPADVHGGFLSLMHTLGERTAELHLALSQRTGNAAFDPQPMTADDVNGWRERAAAEAGRTLDRLAERLPDLPHELQDEAKRLLARASEVRSRVAAFPLDGQTGVKTRFHGDYHLGQVLVSRNDFLIIDFEGEPARSFEERRQRSSALRDVAGMVRSFNYARWSALRRVAQSAEEIAKLEPAAREWEAETRAAFLDAYMGRMAKGGTTQTADAAARLLALFEFEKAMYELRYELDNRLDWVQVPLQGILALVDAHGR